MMVGKREGNHKIIEDINHVAVDTKKGNRTHGVATFSGTKTHRLQCDVGHFEHVL
jgi:hypothetical protein